MLHAHPPYAIGRSLVLEGAALHPVNFEGRLILGSIPIISVGEREAPAEIAEALGRAPIVIVRWHGTFAMAGDLWQALNYTTTLEESAQILTIARDGLLSSEGVPLPRATLLALEREAHAHWLEVVERTLPTAVRSDGWTHKDVVAHVAAWHAFAVRRLRQIELGEPRESVDGDALNAHVKAHIEGVPWATVLNEAKQAYTAFLAAIEAAPTAVLEGDDGCGTFVITANGFGHYAEHLRDCE